MAVSTVNLGNNRGDEVSFDEDSIVAVTVAGEVTVIFLGEDDTDTTALAVVVVVVLVVVLVLVIVVFIVDVVVDTLLLLLLLFAVVEVEGLIVVSVVSANGGNSPSPLSVVDIIGRIVDGLNA
jgi:hypothetical protein